MNRILFCLPLLLVLGFADDEAAIQIREIEAMTPPKCDVSRLSDADYQQSHENQVTQFHRDRNSRIKELYNRFPKNPQVWKLMMDRWLNLARTGAGKELFDETTPILKATTDSSERLDLLYVRAESQVWGPMMPFEPGAAAVDEFIAASPKDERGAELLYFLGNGDKNLERQLQSFRRAAAEPYIATTYGKLAKGCAVQSAGIGKPFELTFTDVTSGKLIDVAKDFKGKIVVVDFWATWCGACVADMPENNRLCESYKKSGVEFVGVSMDESEKDGGLTALKKCIEQFNISWPQYYQGGGVESEFSSKWAITAAPTIFIVGRDGKLASVTASGSLKSVLNEMLRAKKDGKRSTPK